MTEQEIKQFWIDHPEALTLIIPNGDGTNRLINKPIK